MSIDPLIRSTFDYPGLNELAVYLAEVLAMQDAVGWHTFAVDIITSADCKRIRLDNIRMTEASHDLPQRISSESVYEYTVRWRSASQPDDWNYYEWTDSTQRIVDRTEAEAVASDWDDNPYEVAEVVRRPWHEWAPVVSVKGTPQP